jgi:pimeloyl-ACP methyl ester carboxylesterase
LQARDFQIEVPESSLSDLRARLERTRHAPDFGNEDWRYGTQAAYLEELLRYWREVYDWRAHEARMNAYSHHQVEIEGVPIHFMRHPGVAAAGRTPTPLLLTHGWPWTFWDYEKVIGPLTDPAAHGGDPAAAFDVIVPSLPGFGWSAPLTQTGVHWGRTAELWVRLMTDVLGYSRFAAGGGDWGGLVTAELGHRFPDQVIAIHLTLPGHPTLFGATRPEDWGPEEQGWQQHMLERMESGHSHMAVQSRDPQSLAAGLHDSPAGLAAWLIERRRAWSDCQGDLESVFSKEDLLTTLSVYWHTGTIGSSMRFYWESAQPFWQPAHPGEPAIGVPTGIAVFPEDLVIIPRKTAERGCQLVHWSVMDAGGHFAPAEQPEALVQDIWSWWRRVETGL